RSILYELENLPSKIEKALQLENHVKEIAGIYKDARNFLYLGRGYNFPVDLAVALKLKEISYIHAEGYPAAEMKHGPISLIDEAKTVIFLYTDKSVYEKIISKIQDIKPRKGRIIDVVYKDETDISKLADHIIEVPEI